MHVFFQRLIKQSQSFETSHATAKITKHTIKMTSNMTCKRLSRSLNKLLFVPLFCIKLFLFSNTHYTTALEPQQTSWSENPLTPTESRSGISFADRLCRSL
jgi:hypothetical protein